MIVFLEGNNDFTTYFNPPLHGSKVRLVSCSLYNSWYNLIGGSVTINGSVKKIPNSHYTPITLAKELAKHGVTLKTGLPHEWGLTTPAQTSISRPINDLIGTKVVGGKLQYEWEIPRNYEVHCNLVQSCSDGKPSNLMVKFPPKGNPFDLVEYTPISLNYDLSKDLIESIHITIKVDGSTVDFNGRKINLVLEII